MIETIPDKKTEYYGNPFRDRSGRFSLDILLRSHGFCIKRRKGKEEPVWERKGEEFRQRDALRTIPNKEIGEAKEQEDDYRGRI